MKNREQLVAECHRLHGRKNHYKTLARCWQIATGVLMTLLVMLSVLVCFAMGDETEQPVACSTAPAVRALPCPSCDVTWSEERPDSIPPVIRVDQFTPDYVLASVMMSNNNACSGTVIGDDESSTALIVSAAHCVAGNIGRSCWWFNPTGEAFRAELVAYDRGLDVSVFRVDRSKVLAAVKLVIPGGWNPAARVHACGYPGGQGPNLKTACYSGERNARAGMPRWCYDVNSGDFSGGDSGGGLFFDGALAGVVTHATDQYQTMMTVPATSLVDYVEQVAAEHAPGVQYGGRCRPGRPCPPGRRYSDNSDEQAPGPPPNWRPTPNVPITPPKRAPRDGDRDQSIAAIEERLAALEELSKQRADLMESGLGELSGRVDIIQQENGVILSRLDEMQAGTSAQIEKLTQQLTAAGDQQSEKLAEYMQNVDGSLADRLDAFRTDELEDLRNRIGELDATGTTNYERLSELRSKFEQIQDNRRDAGGAQMPPTPDRAPVGPNSGDGSDGGGLVGGVGKAASTVGAITGNPILIGLGGALSVLSGVGIGGWLTGRRKKSETPKRRRRRRAPAAGVPAAPTGQGGPVPSGSGFQAPQQLPPRATVDIREQLQLRELEGRSPILDAAFGLAYGDEIGQLLEGKNADPAPIVDAREFDRRVRERVDELMPVVSSATGAMR